MFAGGVDTSATETKGTVLIHNAEQVNIEKHLFSMLFDSFLYDIVGHMYVCMYVYLISGCLFFIYLVKAINLCVTVDGHYYMN